MLKLDTGAAPFWLEILPAHSFMDGGNLVEIPAQRTRFRPIDTPMVLAARMRASEAAVAHPQTAKAASSAAFTGIIAELGIVEWEGVGDKDGNPVEPTPENIASYLKNWRVFDEIDRKYVMPALSRHDEKNASAPSQNGTSGAKTRAKAIANSARKRAKRARTK
ncbi:MAG TPA: hypothetical protein VGF56_05745 [Rhizomicrobium sp.]|jgi:hypothetical protein